VLLVAACGDQASPIGPPPDLPATITLVAGGSQTAEVATVLPVSLRFRVLNAYGHPLAGESLDVAVTGGHGSVAAPTLVTDSVGEAEDSWTMGSLAGPQSLEARTRTSPGGAPLTVPVTALATPGPLAIAFFTRSRVYLTGESSVTVRIRAQDSFSNPVPIPPVADLDSFGTTQQGESTFTIVGSIPGRYRFVLGPDTLAAVVLLPAGRMRLVEYRGDTVETLRGNLVVALWAASGGDVPPNDSSFAFYDLIGAVGTRVIGGLQTDSVNYADLPKAIYTGVPWIEDSLGHAHPWYGWSGDFSFHRVNWPAGAYDSLTYHPAVLDRFRKWIAIGPQTYGSDPGLGPRDSLTIQ
jgi:hypothetical protein